MSRDSRLRRINHVVGQYYLGGWQGHFSPKHCYLLTTIIRALNKRKQNLYVIVNNYDAQASKKEPERDLISSNACVNLRGNVRAEVKVSSCCRLRLSIFFRCCFPIPGEIFNSCKNLFQQTHQTLVPPDVRSVVCTFMVNSHLQYWPTFSPFSSATQVK